MDQVIRCIKESDYNAIRDGRFVRDGKGMSVRVYYGFNNYNDNPAHVQMLTHIALTETNVKEEDMHVHFVTREESIRHANHLMVQFTEEVPKVKENLRDYTIL